MSKLSLDAFKSLIESNDEFKDNIIGRSDFLDYDNGVIRIYAEHLTKYLEKYSCKDANDLQDTLWYSYGIFCEIKD